ncbi:MAG: PEP-CTERM sorting domain-containing protein [Fimbriimonadaceae bacterium]|nr:PEP-CTERM sorting domain-containing protein [Chthonomonadaceae bacterium]MCO5296387.1 PEP-CTERM sorting domain-containing protein [Fimbriimonadaceae bacterium]
MLKLLLPVTGRVSRGLCRPAFCLLAGLAGFSAGSAQTIFETGFEQPTYSVGDLGGQDGWMITPGNAVGTVQGGITSSGSQAAELIDDASFGRAQRNISGATLGPVIVASYDMYVDAGWPLNMEADRFEAQARIEITGGIGVYGLEFGFVKAPAGGYAGVPPNGAAYYLEAATETTPIDSAYAVVDPSGVVNAWHNYRLVFDTSADLLLLYVDGALATQTPFDESVLSLSSLQLQNQRWGSSPQNNGSVYYDNVYVGTVPEPASLAALALGAAAILTRARRSR